MLKVVHIASGDLWAGAEAQLYTLCKELLRSEKYHVYAILMNNGELAQRLVKLGVTVTIHSECNLNFLQLLTRVRSTLATIKPDVVHTHRQKENILGAIANALSGQATCVRTVHGADEHAFHFLKPHRLAQYWLDQFCGRFLQKSIIAVSKELATQLASQYPAAMIEVIYNGINSSECEQLIANTPGIIGRINSEDSTVDVHIGLVGRLTPVKRPDIFLQTAALLNNQQRSQKLHFHIIGAGPLRGSLETLATDLNLKSCVVFHGHVSPAIKAISELDILVLCSDHEGLPMTLLEAATALTALVIHNVGGMGEVLEQNQTGILVNQHSAEGYAEAINTLIEDPEQRQKICRQAHLLGKDKLSAAHNAELTAACYHSTHSR